jgi:hypothetical protein
MGSEPAHLCLYVIERGRADDGEADEEDIGLGVGEGSQAIVILLTGGIPKSQTYGLAINHDICRVVVETERVNRGRAGKGTVGGWRLATYTVGMYSPGKALVV